MKRYLLGLAATTFALTLVAGCGGGDDSSAGDSGSDSAASPSQDDTADAEGAGSDYCTTLAEDFKPALESLQNPADVTSALEALERAAEDAPSDVSGDWDVMTRAFTSMEGAVDTIKKLQEDLKDGIVTKAQAAQQTRVVMKDMQAIDSPETRKAGEAISAHAKEYCGTTLN